MPVIVEYDETTLLHKVAEGDEAAFNKVFDRYKDKLYGYLLKITKSSEISEEIVTDVFVKLWVGRSLLIHINNLNSFLHKIAYHKAVDFLRTVSRQNKLQKLYVERMEPEPEKRADELLIDAETRELFQKAIQQLPPKRKLIYTLSREKGLTHAQIAKALNLSSNTVKNSIVAATKSIGIFLKNSEAGKAALSILILFC